MKTDLIDERIVELLAQNAYNVVPKLAKTLKVSPVTVRRRIKTLLQNDALRIVGVIDPEKFGLKLLTVIGLDVDQDMIDKAAKTLSAFREVSWVLTTTGRFDIIILVRFESTNELSDFNRNVLAKIEGLKNSETFVCLRQEKGRYSLYFTNIT